MSVFHENMLIGASGQGAAGPTAGRSVRFNSADSAYLSRTPASAGNRKTWTWSGWLKKCSSKNQTLFTCVGAQSDTQAFFIDFLSDDTLRVLGWNTVWRKTTQVFRDFSAWYHIVVAFDSTQSTANNRIRIYVNGSEVTTFATLDNPTQNTDYGINQAALHEIGRYTANSVGYDYLNGYLALVHFIDGQALTPSSFGETSATTGQWIAKDYSGSYGTNGFFLDFLDNSTAAALGYDAAGSNDWTVNNLSVTAGSGNDSLRDHPTSAGTSTGLGGEVSGNYATLNPLYNSASITLANGNLDLTTSSSNRGTAISTIAVNSGKYYVEVTWNSGTTAQIGVMRTDTPYKEPDVFTTYLNTIGYIQSGSIIEEDANIASVSSYAAGDCIGIALNMTDGEITFYKNGVSQGVLNRSILDSGSYLFVVSDRSTTSSSTFTFNAGQRAFAYTAPSGFSPLVDTLLPTPTIAKPNTVMDALLWTGNGSARSITGLGFNPDLVWIKGRSGATDHALYDVVRGAEKRLESNNTDAEVTSDGGVTAFNSDGFSLGTLAQVNTNSATYVAWTWDAGSSNATNTSGTITSTVRANISAGFSVVTYTGTGSSATVGHGLGNAPSFYVIKRRDAASSSLGWIVFSYLNSTLKYGRLDSTSAFASAGESAPTSSVFSILTNADINANGGTYVAYCWTPVAGYSAFGSYTGNGSSTDGPYIHLGFRAAVIMVKMSSSTGNWTILDDKREGYNVDNDPLYPNLGSVEGTTDLIDITSNGFKVRTTDATFNTNAGTYIYAAWASAPFPYSRAR